METTEKPKRTYQKHKTEKKITVIHYLNTSIAESDYFDETVHPIYVQVTYNRKTTKFRSHIPSTSHYPLANTKYIPELADMDDNKYSMKYEKFINDAIKRDENLIKWIIYHCVNLHEDFFQIHHLPKIYHDKRYTLNTFIKWCLNQDISQTRAELRFSKSQQSSENDCNNSIWFPITFEASPLVNLEFNLKSTPELIILKEKYSSQIWFFDIFSACIENIEKYNRENYIYEEVPEEFYVPPFTLTPTLYDYEQNDFRQYFNDIFLNSKIVDGIIDDIDKLFQKYNEKYYLRIQS